MDVVEQGNSSAVPSRQQIMASSLGCRLFAGDVVLGGHTAGMNLAELMARTKGDRTYEQLSRDCGGTPSAQRLQQIATTTPQKFPDVETLNALARGLHVQVKTVVLAAAVSLGLDVGVNGGPGWLELLPPAAANLTDVQVDAVRTVIQAMNAPAAEVASVS
ncbi:hypothetical protein [Georgenia yuyongxinii]|uniref:Uncharacterized protein n=1 Tax=Georgenia yuyongxinii TaxID=2589797 RepID=A0A552WSL3_9MICO|nr:hypothetical protein [Georgenia yuyongxinii]TRW45599.1 hypothetical protein FJ693_08685 [Georgenia yuyongxinii]